MLVVTVLVLSILFVLAYAISYSAGVNVAMARNVRGTLAKETAQESALNYALALLEKDGGENGYDTLEERWAQAATVAVDGKEFNILVRDEDRRLNVNLATQPPDNPEKDIDLRAVLERVVTAAGGAKPDYDMLMTACDAMRPVLFIEELLDIAGLDERLFENEEEKPALDALLSTHPRRVNVNTAAPAVIESLWPDAAPGRELARRRDERPFEDEAELVEFVISHSDEKYGERLTDVLSVSSDFFTVSVAPATGRGERLTALVRRAGPAANLLLVRRMKLESEP